MGRADLRRAGIACCEFADTAHMSQVIEIDLRNRFITAQAGAGRAALNAAVAAEGYECAGILAAEMVLPSGEMVTLGDKTEDVNGYDLLGLALDSDAGIIAEITVRLVRASTAASPAAAERSGDAFSPETQKTLEAVRSVFRDA